MILEQSDQLDPNNALHMRECGVAYCNIREIVGGVCQREQYEKAREAVGRALETRPELGGSLLRGGGGGGGGGGLSSATLNFEVRMDFARSGARYRARNDSTS
jgi:hypothetical protein